jgi:hypothetical protein
MNLLLFLYGMLHLPAVPAFTSGACTFFAFAYILLHIRHQLELRTAVFQIILRTMYFSSISLHKSIVHVSSQKTSCV